MNLITPRVFREKLEKAEDQPWGAKFHNET